jgi:hypothetical protein
MNGEAQAQDPKGPARSNGRASRRRFGARAGGSDLNIFVAMSCPCCGAGAMSFTAKLKR